MLLAYRMLVISRILWVIGRLIIDRSCLIMLCNYAKLIDFLGYSLEVLFVTTLNCLFSLSPLYIYLSISIYHDFFK